MFKTTYTIQEAAELMSCSPDTIRRAIKSGELKAAKLGKDYRISQLDIVSYYRHMGGGRLLETGNRYYAICSRCGLEWDCEHFKPIEQYSEYPYFCPSSKEKNNQKHCGLKKAKIIPAINLENEQIFCDKLPVVLLVEGDDTRMAVEIIYEMKKNKTWPKHLIREQIITGSSS
jgi:excisionase family DNA binding protein